MIYFHMTTSIKLFSIQNYKMKEKINNTTILQVALIAGIVILASMGLEGWGWLVFALLCTL